MAFKKAERKQAFLKLAVTGPSGSGKSYSSLLIARGLVGPTGKVAGLDTENGSLSLYADKPEIQGFEVDEIEPPFTVAKYCEAIDTAVKAGFDILVIDSLTHAWAGEGGLLDKKESLDQRGGNGYTNWAKITKEHEALKSKLLHSNIHIIVTMRSKQDYILVENEKGKQQPKKVGLAPIQRDGMEYEFTTVFDLAMNHTAEVSKDRSGLFDGTVFKPTLETGEALARWLEGQPAGVTAARLAREAGLSAATPAVTEKPNVGAPVGKPFDMKILSSPQTYVPRFGRFEGSALGTLNPFEVQKYICELEAEYKITKTITPECSEFVRVAMAYVAKYPPATTKASDDIPDFAPAR